MEALSDRWEPAWPQGDTTNDRLGDHTAARYRHFRQYMEQLEADKLYDELFALLLSAESLRDEIRPYEEVSSLNRLAQTGYIVRKLQQLNGILDAVSAEYDMVEPDELAQWKDELERERDERIARFRDILNDEAGIGSIGYAKDGESASDSSDKTQVEEAMSLLRAGLDMYGDGVLSDSEKETIQCAIAVAGRRSGMSEITLPEWFAPPFKFGGTFGLGRWGNDLLFPDHGSRERLIQEATIWSGLNHPHIAKFLGACHVGARPFIAHEKVKSMVEYLSEVTERAKVWRRLYELALALQYLHERGLACENLTMESVYCAQFEDKTLLLGVGVMQATEPEWEDGNLDGDEMSSNMNGEGSRALMFEADIYALGLCILRSLSVLSSSTQHEGSSEASDDANEKHSKAIPENRPSFITETEWNLITQMRSEKSGPKLSLQGVIKRLGEFADLATNERSGDDNFVASQLGASEATGDLEQLVVPSVGLSVAQVLRRCGELAACESQMVNIHARLVDVAGQLESKNDVDATTFVEVAERFCGILVRLYWLLQQKAHSSVATQVGMARREPVTIFSFHSDIDRLVGLGSLSRVDEVHSWQTDWEFIDSSVPSALSLEQAMQDLSLTDSETSEEVEAFLEFERNRRQIVSRASQLSKLPRWFLPPYEVDFRSLEAIGKGAFASVHHGKWFETPVAIKSVLANLENKSVIRQQFRREADVWFNLNHVNIVKMYGACHVDRLFFVCEYASGGDLMTYLSKNDRQPFLIWYTLLNAALGLQYLHESGVVHGDLKTDNILVGSDGIAKLADFGLSVRTQGRSANATGGAVGGYQWKAPECIPSEDGPGQAPTFASDVYSFAMCMVEAIGGGLPWGDALESAVLDNVRSGLLPPRPSEIGYWEWRLIERMCCSDPTKRVTIDVVVDALTSFVERLEMNQVMSDIATDERVRHYKNRVISRDGALLSVLSLAKSDNTALRGSATRHLQAIHINRGARSNNYEIGRIVHLLSNGREHEKAWAASAVLALSWNNDVNRVLIAAAGAIPVLVGLVRAGTDEQKDHAAGTLRNLAMNEDNRVMITATGVITELVALARDGNDDQKSSAVGALKNLAVIGDEELVIAAAGGIPVLVAIARDGTDDQKEQAADALRNLAINDGNRGPIAAVGGIPVLVSLVRDGTGGMKRAGAGGLLNVALDDNNAAEIIAEGAVPMLLELMQAGNDAQKAMAKGALVNLCSREGVFIPVKELGGACSLAKLAQEGDDVEKEAAVVLLNNMAGREECHAEIIDTGVVPLLVDFVCSGNDLQKDGAAASLVNLALNNVNKPLIVAAGGVPVLLASIQNAKDSLKVKVTLGLALLAQDTEIGTAIAEAGAIPVLVDLIQNDDDILKEVAGYALMCLAKGNVANRSSIVVHGGVSALVGLLASDIANHKACAAALLVSLEADSETKTAIIKHGGISALLAALAIDDFQDFVEDLLVALSVLCCEGDDTLVRSSADTANGLEVLSKLAEHENERYRELGTLVLAKLSASENL